jgi:O-antigen ligase
MTTSISNASPARRRSGRRSKNERQATRPAPESGRTAAGRFVVFVLCAVVVLSTLAFGTVHAWSLATFAAGACLVVLLWAADAWRSRTLRVSANFLQLPLLGLFALGLVQLLPLGGAPDTAAAGLAADPVRSLSLDPYATRMVLVQLGALIVYFAAALAFIDSPRRLRLVTRTVIVFGFLLALLGLMQHFVSPDKIYGIRETKQALGFGPFINRHHFANYMAMAAALPLGLLFAGAVEPDRRLLYVFSAVLMGIALVMTNSRGGMLSVCAEVLFLVVVSGLVRGEAGWRRTEADRGGRALARRLLPRAAAGAGLVVALVAGVLFFGGDESLNRLLGTVNAEDPTTGRLHFWRGALGIISARPFLGAGLGAFGAAYPLYDTGNGSVYRLEQAHNDYLQLLSDGGIVGGALGILFVVALFTMALRNMQSADLFRRGVALGALAGCFAALVHSFFDFPLHIAANGLLFLTLAALATAGGRVEPARRSRKRNRQQKDGDAAAHEAAPGDLPTPAQQDGGDVVAAGGVTPA